MKGDALFFLGILFFFFILWYASGGPTKPISFAGPYITPITDVGTVQQGYNDTGALDSGQSIWADIMNLEDGIASLQKNAYDLRSFGEASPYRGQVTVSSAAGASATDPDQEYVVIRASGTVPVTISGWRVVSGATKNSARIPYGTELPRSNRVNDTLPIVLQPGDEAYITTGESPLGVSFKENMCTGYLGKNQGFFPTLQTSCPSALDEFERYYTGNKLRDDACYQLVQQAAPCSVPRETSRSSAACVALIDDHLTYTGCVATHQRDSRFPGTTWRIYLEYEDDGDPEEFWKSTRDAVKLVDEQGLTVDLYTY